MKPNSKLPRVISEYRYRGELVAKTVLAVKMPAPSGISLDSLALSYYRPMMVVKIFEVVIEDSKLERLVEEMPLEEKLHWKSLSYGVQRAIKENLDGKTPQDFVSDEDLGVYVLELNGVHSMADLYHKDRCVWNLVKKRRLAKKIFSGYGKERR